MSDKDKKLPTSSSQVVLRTNVLLERIRPFDLERNKPQYQLTRPLEGNIPQRATKPSSARAAFIVPEFDESL